MSNRSVFDRLREKLESMNRKTWMYKGFLIKILDWSFDNEMCRLETSRQVILRPQIEVLKELDEFLETEEEMDDEEQERSLSSVKETPVLVPKLKSFEVCDNFMDALTRAMDEVEHNADFVPRAKVMTEIAGKAIDYAKVQVDAYKVASDIMNKNR